MEEITWSVPRSAKSSWASEPEPEPAPRRPQTWLDRITRPPLTRFHAETLWLQRFRDPEAYSEADLRERERELEASLLPEAQARYQQPPPEWTDQEWTAAHDRYLKLRGQLLAIRDTLRVRRLWGSRPLPGGSTSGPGCSPSTATLETGWDPFAEE